MKSEESIVQYGGGSLDYVCKQVCMHVCMFCMYVCMNVCMYIVVTFPRQSNCARRTNAALSGECNLFVGCYP